MATIAEVNAAIYELTAKFDALKTHIHVVITYGDSLHAIMAASALDDALELALLSKMRQLNSDMKKRIFEGHGPLSNLAGKIDIAYALEVITHEFYESLRKINNIRVKFAHQTTLLTFQDHEISAIIDSLPNLDPTIADRKERYLKKIVEINAYLARITDQTIEGPT
jgi:DNA-binding MltR family transcriptional regulator